MGRKLTTPEFKAKAVLIHGDKYDYSKAEYVDSKTKVCIICPEHGEFWQTTTAHFNGQNCYHCGRIDLQNKRKTTFFKLKGGGAYTVLDDNTLLVPLGNNCSTTISVEDKDLVSKHVWFSSKGYAYNGSVGYLHRFIMGVEDPNVIVDHVDRNPLNNQRSNLRITTRKQNNRNRRGLHNKSSKYLGVCKKDNKWLATICIDGKQKYLGRFDKEEDAAHARDKASLEYYGDITYLNFPQQ